MSTIQIGKEPVEHEFDQEPFECDFDKDKDPEPDTELEKETVTRWTGQPVWSNQLHNWLSITS